MHSLQCTRTLTYLLLVMTSQCPRPQILIVHRLYNRVFVLWDRKCGYQRSTRLRTT